MNKNVAFEVREGATLILGARRAGLSSSCSLILGGGAHSIGLSDVFKALRAANLNKSGATVGLLCSNAWNVKAS